MGCLASHTVEQHVVNEHTLSNFDTRSRYSFRSLEQDYEVLRTDVIGQGSNGSVTKVRSRLNGHVHALKSLKKQFLDKKRLQNLQDEANNYLRIDHPNIARLLHVYEDSCHVHLVMELCPGRELFDHVTKTRLSEPEAKHIVQQLLLAVAYLHRHKIIHCDIKLENIMYDSEMGGVKLIDFGFSKDMDRRHALYHAQGTLSYTAPELFLEQVTDKCDVWSCGVVAFILLSNVPPFPMADTEESRKRIQAGKYKFREQRWEGISEEAKQFIRQLLVVEPAKRLSAMEALQDAWLTVKNANAPRPSLAEANSQALLDGLRRYEGSSHMARAAFAMIAHHLSSADLEGVRSAFLRFDTDMTGTITRDNFTEALGGVCDLRDGELGRLFDTVDTAGDGEIHYSEFAAAMLGSWIALNKDSNREAFELFDVSRTGYITRDDLAQVLGGRKQRFEDAGIDTLMYECCGCTTNGITFEAFSEHLASGGKIQPKRSTSLLSGLFSAATHSWRGVEDLFGDARSPTSSRSSSKENPKDSTKDYAPSVASTVSTDESLIGKRPPARTCTASARSNLSVSFSGLVCMG